MHEFVLVCVMAAWRVCVLASCVQIGRASWRAACAVSAACSCREGQVFVRVAMKTGCSMHKGGAVKLEIQSRGEQRLGEELTFVRMEISLVVACVVCCHGYKAGCNLCVQVSRILKLNRSQHTGRVHVRGVRRRYLVLTVHLLPPCGRA
jgi:hypothetical protein